MKVLLSKEMRTLEADSDRMGVSYDRLMENAGDAVAKFLTGLLPQAGCCLLLCGSGNNGGDGYVVARLLKEQGHTVELLAPLGPPKTLSARRAAAAARKAGIQPLAASATPDWDRADVVVDSLFGTSFHGALPGEILALLPMLEHHRCVVSVDLPSGLRADSPQPAGEGIWAHHTLLLEAAKPAGLMLPAAARCGQLHLLPIDVAPAAWEGLRPCGRCLDLDGALALLPTRLAIAHKGDFGRLLALCGSSSFTGAAALAARAALASGVGLVTLATTERVAATVGASLWEATFFELAANGEGGVSAEVLPALLERAKGADALLAGCGLGGGSDVAALVEGLLTDCRCQLVLDADALNALVGQTELLARAAHRPILTPHVGEMARLTGCSAEDIKADAPRIALDFAALWRAVVVLKDASTVVAAPDGRFFVTTGGNSGLAKGGSGDLLAGMIASLAAQGMEAAEAAAAAVALHDAAGQRCATRLSRRGMLPHELLDDLRGIFAEQERRG